MVAFLNECLNPAAGGRYGQEQPGWAKLYVEVASVMKNYTEAPSV